MQEILDWEGMRGDYVQGYWQRDSVTQIRHIYYPTFEDLAQKWGCGSSSIRTKAGKERWTYQRSVFRAKINEMESDRRISLFMSESAQLDAFVLDCGHDLGKVIGRQIKKLNPELEELDVKIPEAKASELLTLAKTLEMLQTIGRRAVGEPISGINQHDIAAVQPDGDPENRKHRIEELLKRRQQLEAQIKRVKKQNS